MTVPGSDEIRLYVFACGTLETEVHLLNLNQGLREPLSIPVPWYLLTHPRGHVIVDGGNAPQVAVDAEAHWGRGSVRRFRPVMTPEQACVPELERLGIDLGDVRWIVQTHLHNDHTGAVAQIERLPAAQVLVARREWQFAHAPHPIMASAYIQADFRKRGVRWSFVEDGDDGYDLFGDGVLRVWHTPGHSPGHLSVEITLPQSGTMLLTADACHTAEQWSGRALSAVTTSLLDHVTSLERLRRLADRTQATVVLGHDMATFLELRRAPEHYT